MAQPTRILVVRLGAMGDILHALPAVASLRQSFPEARISWMIAPKWKALLNNNPDVDDVALFHRSQFSEITASFRALRLLKPDLALDFQGLLQSALVGRTARPRSFFGWHPSTAKESAASFLYSNWVKPVAAHVVERNIELAVAAGARAVSFRTPIPEGHPDGLLPSTPFVLASPFAGWAGKQWPIQNYEALAQQLKKAGLEMVVNVSPSQARQLSDSTDLIVHTSSLEGLIYATRQCVAVIGVDSGPLHLAAALKKPGVALFGPTDPNRNGPYGGTIKVLRAPGIASTYRRDSEIHPSMRSIKVEEVYQSLMAEIKQAEFSV